MLCGAASWTRKEAVMMELSDYALVQLANERLAHAREVASRRALVASVTPRESLRVRLGAALVALGRCLLGEPPPQRGTPGSGGRAGRTTSRSPPLGIARRAGRP